MNTTEQLATYGQSLVGKKAQSTILTMISQAGTMVLQPAAKITAFNVCTWCEEPVLMVTIDNVEVFEDTLRNIH